MDVVMVVSLAAVLLMVVWGVTRGNSDRSRAKGEDGGGFVPIGDGGSSGCGGGVADGGCNAGVGDGGGGGGGGGGGN